MKIVYRTYSFAGSPAGETRKPVAARTKTDPPVAAGVVFSPATLPGATLRHLETIARMTSELMNMVRGDPVLQTGGSATEMSADEPDRTAVSAGDILIFLPPVAREGQSGQCRGELIAVKGAVPPGTDGDPEGSEEDAPGALVKDIARKLSAVAAGLGTGTMDLDSRQVREKFIISVEAPGNVPVPSIIRHDPSGATTVPGEDGSPAAGSPLPREVAVITAFLKDAGEEVLLEETSRDPAPASSGAGQEGEIGATPEEAAASVRAFPFTRPAAAIKEMREALSFFFSGNDDETGTAETKEEGAQGRLTAESENGTASVTLAGRLPGVVVTVMGAAPAASSPGSGPLPARDIAEKVSILSDAIGGLAADDAPGTGGAADDGGAEAAVKLVPMVKDMVKQAVRESFLAAAGNGGNNIAAGTPGAFGMAIDEKGLLKIDRAVFAESLSGDGGEAAGFVRDFAGALHDRITYNAYAAFAGLCAGTEERVLDGPGGKEGAGNEDTDAKAGFEKRLNELQMLLETSYELKESFIQGRAAQGNGQIRDI